MQFGLQLQGRAIEFVSVWKRRGRGLDPGACFRRLADIFIVFDCTPAALDHVHDLVF